jgi:hypothetical protein
MVVLLLYIALVLIKGVDEPSTVREFDGMNSVKTCPCTIQIQKNSLLEYSSSRLFGRAYLYYSEYFTNCTCSFSRNAPNVLSIVARNNNSSLPSKIGINRVKKHRNCSGEYVILTLVFGMALKNW